MTLVSLNIVQAACEKHKAVEVISDILGWAKEQLDIGDYVYLHTTRNEKVQPVCGACEGAKVFDVLHRDGSTHQIPCAKCGGKGKLFMREEHLVVDVVRAQVVGIIHNIGQVRYFASREWAEREKANGWTEYRVLGAGNLDEVVTTPGQETPPADLPMAHKRLSLNRKLYWRDRKVALAIAGSYNERLRAMYAKGTT